jgi:hypothetical protein
MSFLRSRTRTLMATGRLFQAEVPPTGFAGEHDLTDSSFVTAPLTIATPGSLHVRSLHPSPIAGTLSSTQESAKALSRTRAVAEAAVSGAAMTAVKDSVSVRHVADWKESVECCFADHFSLQSPLSSVMYLLEGASGPNSPAFNVRLLQVLHSAIRKSPACVSYLAFLWKHVQRRAVALEGACSGMSEAFAAFQRFEKAEAPILQFVSLLRLALRRIERAGRNAIKQYHDSVHVGTEESEALVDAMSRGHESLRRLWVPPAAEGDASPEDARATAVRLLMGFMSEALATGAVSAVEQFGEQAISSMRALDAVQKARAFVRQECSRRSKQEDLLRSLPAAISGFPECIGLADIADEGEGLRQRSRLAKASTEPPPSAPNSASRQAALSLGVLFGYVESEAEESTQGNPYRRERLESTESGGDIAARQPLDAGEASQGSDSSQVPAPAVQVVIPSRLKHAVQATNSAKGVAFLRALTDIVKSWRIAARTKHQSWLSHAVVSQSYSALVQAIREDLHLIAQFREIPDDVPAMATLSAANTAQALRFIEARLDSVGASLDLSLGELSVPAVNALLCKQLLDACGQEQATKLIARARCASEPLSPVEATLPVGDTPAATRLSPEAPPTRKPDSERRARASESATSTTSQPQGTMTGEWGEEESVWGGSLPRTQGLHPAGPDASPAARSLDLRTPVGIAHSGKFLGRAVMTTGSPRFASLRESTLRRSAAAAAQHEASPGIPALVFEEETVPVQPAPVATLSVRLQPLFTHHEEAMLQQDEGFRLSFHSGSHARSSRRTGGSMDAHDDEDDGSGSVSQSEDDGDVSPHSLA